MIKRFLVALLTTLLTGLPLAAQTSYADVATVEHRPDILLIGSEIEGMYLARAAADEGLDVMIIDPRPRPGGQLLEGEMLFLDEPRGDGGQELVQGQIKALFDAYKQGSIRKIEEFRDYFRELAEGIALVSGVTIDLIDVRQQPDATGRFVETVGYSTPDGRPHIVYPRYVVDNTDYAALTSHLGLTRIPGMETVFETPDGAPDYMAATMIMKFKKVNWDVFYEEVMKLDQATRVEQYGSETTVTPIFTWGFGKVGAAYDSGRDDWFLRGLNIVNQHDGEALINALLVYGVDPSNVSSVRDAVTEGKRQTDRVQAHLRRTLPGWEHAEVNGYPNYLYIRDYDRYETEYVLQGTDLMSGRMFWDNVSIGGYELDLQGTMNNKWGVRKGTPDKYGMPLRSFMAKGYRNVIVAGKNVGASAVAYGSARIQAHTALAAETIGLMLGRIDGQYELADMTPERMQELHDWIREEHHIKLTDISAVDKTNGMSQAQREAFNQGKTVIP